MSLTFGFYNALLGDRKYNATQISKIFDGIIKDGIFASIGDTFVVTASTGMTVIVGTGRAWFNHTWTDNDALLPLVVDASELVLTRIDSVVLEVNESNDARQNTIKIVKGIPSSFPENPTLINNDSIHQYPLCYIKVLGGATSIKQTDITNVIGTSECPFITGIIDYINIDGITAIMNAEWDEWFATVKDQLDGDVAGNLLNMINNANLLSEGEPLDPGTNTVWYDVLSTSTITI